MIESPDGDKNKEDKSLPADTLSGFFNQRTGGVLLNDFAPRRFGLYAIRRRASQEGKKSGTTATSSGGRRFWNKRKIRLALV